MIDPELLELTRQFCIFPSGRFINSSSDHGQTECDKDIPTPIWEKTCRQIVRRHGPGDDCQYDCERLISIRLQSAAAYAA